MTPRAAIVLGVAFAAACHEPGAPGWEWQLPGQLPVPRVPTDNPMSAAKVELGRHLFYEPRLSVNGEMSCATCHQQARAFTDGRARAVGTTGQLHPRGSMSLVNVAYASRLGWANPLLDSLEAQALVPMFGDTPIEMGLAGHEDDLVATLASEPRHAERFALAWPDDPVPVTIGHIVQAIASFERTIISASSPYDRYLAGDAAALTPAAQRGHDLFFSERLECFHCHGGFNFTDAVDHTGLAAAETGFHNTGLYDLDGRGAYPDGNTGVRDVTGDDRDMGRFKAPTLRNIAVTAPYMHDGSVPTLVDALAHYERGGRRIGPGPTAGDGARSPRKSEFVAGFVLGDRERQDVLAFLDSLTDPVLLTDPRLGDPRR